MKRIFTLLFISFFFLNAFPQATVEVFVDGSDIDSLGKTINVLAGQDITLHVIITS